MKEAHEAAAYNQWLSAEIQASIDTLQPCIPHDEAMAARAGRISERHRFYRVLSEVCTIEILRIKRPAPSDYEP